MFPDKNIHYLRNYHYGYQGVNYINGSEYNNRFKYDQGKAMLIRQANSPHNNRINSQLEQLRINYSQSICNPASIPPQQSQDVFSGAYPESVRPLDEDPQNIPEKQQPALPAEEPQHIPEKQPSLQPEPKEMESPQEDIEREYQKSIEQNMKEIPQQAYNDPPVNPPEQKEILPQHPAVDTEEDEWKKIVKQQVKAADAEKVNNEIAKKARIQNYKEELDRQLNIKNSKRALAQSMKTQERQKALEWQQEMDRQDKAKIEEAKQMQELSRQYYEKQIQDKSISRIGKSSDNSRVNAPPINKINKPSPVNEYLNASLPQDIPKNSYSTTQKAPVESMMMQDIDRQRFKQVKYFLNIFFRKLIKQIENKKQFIEIT